MRLYETTVVIDPQYKSIEIEDVIKKISNFITNHGGEIVKVDEWGKRRLAYEIDKRQYGYYVHMRFTGPGQIIGLLEREYRLSEAILRFLTIKVDKRALQAEALQQAQEAAAAEPIPPAPAEEKAEVPEAPATEEGGDVESTEVPVAEPDAAIQVADDVEIPEVSGEPEGVQEKPEGAPEKTEG